jgi:hypothetical protein
MPGCAYFVSDPAVLAAPIPGASGTSLQHKLKKTCAGLFQAKPLRLLQWENVAGSEKQEKDNKCQGRVGGRPWRVLNLTLGAKVETVGLASTALLKSLPSQ